MRAARRHQYLVMVCVVRRCAGSVMGGCHRLGGEWACGRASVLLLLVMLGKSQTLLPAPSPPGRARGQAAIVGNTPQATDGHAHRERGQERAILREGRMPE